MIRKKRKYAGFAMLAAIVMFAPLVAMAYEIPLFEYDSSLELSYAGRMAQDADGNVYVADTRRGRVNVFDKYGRALDAVTTVAQPTAVAAGPDGAIYVASYHGVYLLGDNGQASSIVAQDELDYPVDMAVDAEEKIYLLDSGTRSVKVFSSTGIYLDEFAGGAAKYPVSLAIGRDSVSGVELIYVGYSVETTDADNTEIVFVYDLSYNLVRSIGPAIKLTSWRESLPPSGAVTKASGLAVDTVGRLYIADIYSGRINVYSEQGHFLSDYSVALDSAPVDLIFDHYGRLFVSLLSGSVKILSVDGQNVDNVVPSAPSLVSPVGGVRIGTQSPELLVANSTDLNGDNLVYEFDLSHDVNMLDIVWSSGPVAEGGDGHTAVYAGFELQEDSEYYWRVRSFDGIEYSRYSYVSRFFVNSVNSPPIIESYSPLSDVVLGVLVDQSVEFSLDAVDSDRDQIAVVWFVNGLEVGTGGKFAYLTEISDVGENIIKVVVDDGQLVVERQWSVTVMRPNTAPTSPSINFPNGSVDVSTLRPELSVSNSSDAEGDAVTYRFEVSRADNFSDIVATVADVPAGASFTSAILGADLIENGLYYWRSKACEISVAGSYVAEYYCSSPSATGSFVVNTVNDQVGAPSVSSPASATHVNTIERQLALSVNNATDPDINDVLTYDFVMASDEGFQNVILNNEAIAEGGAGSTSVDVAVTLEENFSYYWKARAGDGETVSPWVISSFFVDNINDSPTIPVIESPASSAEVTTLSPILSVLNSSDFNGDTLSYLFEIDSADNFSSPARQVSDLVAEADMISSWSVALPLIDNTRYYWRVKASDGVSESEWSVVNQFFVNTANDAPTTPVVKAPSAGVAVNVDMPGLTIYGASDIDGDEIVYVYQVSRTADFSSLESESGAEGIAWRVDVHLAENATYYWKAKAIDEHGLSGDWSDNGSFMVNVVNENPGAPVAGSYSYDAESEVLLHIGGAVDPDADTLSYAVELYSDRSMSSLVYSEDNVAGDDEITSNAGVLAPGVYYWRVRAYDGKLYGSWSDTRIIRVNGSGISNDNRTDKAQGHKRF